MVQLVDKLAVARAFGRAALQYDRYAVLQRMSGDGLLNLAPKKIGRDVLDAGCGTGWYSLFWRKRGCHVIAFDLSFQMLQQANLNRVAEFYLVGDIDAIPLASRSIDLVWSNLVVQWSENLSTVLAQFLRVLRPGGYALFSTLLTGSLRELDNAWSHFDKNPHVNRFLTAQDVISICSEFNVRFSCKEITFHFPDVLTAMHSVKGIGATHLHAGRKSGLLTRRKLILLERFWVRDLEGYPLTYYLMYGVLKR